MDARLNLKISPETHARLAKLAKKEGRSIVSQIKNLLDFYEKAAPTVKDMEKRVSRLEKALNPQKKLN